MRLQLVGCGNVARSLLELMADSEPRLKERGVNITVTSVSDSKGTAIDEKGLDPRALLKAKRSGWKSFEKYVRDYSATDALNRIEADVVVELTPSTLSGEPGLSNIRAALIAGKNVVTANKGPLVVSYWGLMDLAKRKRAKLYYEATVAAQLPVFCLLDSCFKLDRVVAVQGILNATTNFIIGEMEKGGDFETALKTAIEAGWAEADYSDDVNGIDSARKVVILASSLFHEKTGLSNVKVRGIRAVEEMVREAKKTGKKVKLVCDISRKNGRLKMSVEPRCVPLNDPLSTVNRGDMALKFVFETSREIFVSAQFNNVRQTAYAVLNDVLKAGYGKGTC